MNKTEIAILIMWVIALLILIVIPKETYGYNEHDTGYTFQDLKREIQDASMDCRNVGVGQLPNGYVFVEQYCTYVSTHAVTTVPKTLVIDFDGLRWKRFNGLTFKSNE